MYGVYDGVYGAGGVYDGVYGAGGLYGAGGVYDGVYAGCMMGLGVVCE